MAKVHNDSVVLSLCCSRYRALISNVLIVDDVAGITINGMLKYHNLKTIYRNIELTKSRKANV